ncbi:hypothetical protein DFA_06050 [Cavenderia fasciculata]|uniref:U-box domain-containing protein n=1 Tax=Cavenderia fasciculata TaxID=261658 RepID=F4PJY8_CACFS|nr:uncharacterized protein DFA_06050 [Cavenderia fasciculata]EGG23912.1 hypothetical protein DFA_06050 [Cavenderia fasciculata]|eukprot:XP_004361763.1 hypothetical protein DFA_06050 [Cavenderia fasciculata]
MSEDSNRGGGGESSIIVDQAEHLNNILIDPISLSTIEDPVLTTCGHSFSRETIEDWLSKKQTCPLCHKTISKDQLTPNYSLKEIIDHLAAIQNNQNNQNIINSSSSFIQNDNSSSIISNNNVNSNNNNQNNDILSSQISMLANQLADLSSKIDQSTKIAKPIPKEKEYIIREIWGKETKACATMMQRSTWADPFMTYFFQGESWTKSGSEWYFGCMLNYALKRARVWGVFNNKPDRNGDQMLGVMICQPPNEVGVRIVEMIKAGMVLATYKMGIAPLSRVLNLFQKTEKVHSDVTRGRPHWYINAIIVDILMKRNHIGTDLINTVLQLADSQKVAVYIDTASSESLKFLEKFNFKIMYHSTENGMVDFWALLREPN